MTLYEAIVLLRARWPWLLIVPGVLATLIVVQPLVVPPDTEARAVIRVNVPSRVLMVMNSRTFAARIGATGTLIATQDKRDGFLDLTATAPAPIEVLRMLTTAIDTVTQDEQAQQQYQTRQRVARLRRALDEQGAVMLRRDPFAVIDYARLADQLERLRAEPMTTEDPVTVLDPPALVPRVIDQRRALAAAFVGLGLVCCAIFLRAWWIAELASRPPGVR